jgi:hypothetical protein
MARVTGPACGPPAKYSSHAEESTRFTRGPSHERERCRFPSGSRASNLQDSIVVFADTATFLYDVNGNLLVADNRDAQIRRSYFASGQLRSDSLRPARYTWVAEIVAPVFSGSWFIQGYSYDLSGKRLARSTDHTSCSGCIQSYHHEPQSGLLDWTEDRGSPSGTRLASRSATTERGAS